MKAYNAKNFFSAEDMGKVRTLQIREEQEGHSTKKAISNCCRV
jgi:hypothetical protein